MEVVQQLNEEYWREFVDNHPQGRVFHTPDMYQAFTSAKGHRPTLWATVDARQRPLALLLPVQITLMNGLMRVLTTRAVAFASVLCAPGTAGQAALALLLQTYHQEVKRSVLFTELRNMSDSSDWQPTLNEQGFAYEPHLNFLIDLTRPPAELWNNIRSNARRNIQKARRSNVAIVEADNAQEVTEAYAILKDVYARIQVPLPDLSLFQTAFELMHSSGMLRILLAKLDGVSIGALTLLFYKGVLLYWYTGTLREYAQYRAGDFLVWRALEMGQQLGCHTFDFGGGGKPDEEYGVRDFKIKFGGELVNFGRNVCIHAPLRLRISRAGYQLMRRFL